MSGPSKSYWRKSTAPTPIKKTAIGAGGTPVEYLEWDLYEHNHTPDSYVMNSAGVCTSNPGMDAEYFSQGPERGDGGRQGIFYGGSGDLKIKPREYIFQVASHDFTGTCKIVLVDNITSDLTDMQLTTTVPWSSYTGDGIVGAWVMVGEKLVYVSEITDVYTGLTVRDMINAPVYLKDETSGTIIKSVSPKPLYIENIDASPEWVLLTSFTITNVFPAPEYYT